MSLDILEEMRQRLEDVKKKYREQSVKMGGKKDDYMDAFTYSVGECGGYQWVIEHEYDTEGHYFGLRKDGKYEVWYDAAMRGKDVWYTGSRKKAWEMFVKTFTITDRDVREAVRDKRCRG